MLGFIVLLLIVGVFWAVVLTNNYSSFVEWFLFTVLTYVILVFLVFVVGHSLTKPLYRDVKVDKISLVGDSYVIERDDKTQSIKQDDVTVDIGDVNYITYKRITSPKNLFNDLFGFTDEKEQKQLSDDKFVEDGKTSANVVKIGIDKNIIK